MPVIATSTPWKYSGGVTHVVKIAGTRNVIYVPQANLPQLLDAITDAMAAETEVQA